VGAVLGDALRRVAVLGGREGMPRSLGSVHGGCVTRFLGGSLRGVVSRVIPTPGVKSLINGVAVSVDGSTLLVSTTGGSETWGIHRNCHAIHEFSTADGSRRRIVGCWGTRRLQFRHPRQVYIAPDDFVFVADSYNNRVQVLTPSLDFHAFVGVGDLLHPSGVCANADVVVVSEFAAHRIAVFNRCDGALLRRFGCDRSGDGARFWPQGLCLMSDDRHIAAADSDNHRVSVFSVDGEFVRHVGVGVLSRPFGVACSPFDELVVADCGNKRVTVFSASGVVVRTMGHGDFTGVAIRPGHCVVFAQDYGKQCVVFE
jgi:DNA-binding beta-propeller fold protein YncE